MTEASDSQANGEAVPNAEPQVPRLSRAERRERALCDAMRTFIRDLHFHRHGATDAGGAPLPLTLKFSVAPNEGWDVQFTPPLVEQVAAQMDDAMAEYGAFEQGRVHCFRCGHASCEHSTPPDALHVFRGYAQTGVPEWTELAQLLIDLKDERVDLLFSKPPAVLATMQLGRELRKQQFSFFGKSSKTYSILGQVVAGYLKLPARAAGECGTDRLALTLQAVETRGPRGSMRLKLNAIAGGLSADTLSELLATSWQAGAGRVITTASNALEELAHRVDAARESAQPTTVRKHLRRVPAVLSRMARSFEQSYRQGRRRTHHAQHRRTQERPVHKALDDAGSAGDDALFYDEKHETWVARGKQGRVHAFNREGRHVTSFFMQPGGAEFRVRTNRWRRLNEDEAAAFRKRLQRAAVGDRTADQQVNAQPLEQK